VSTSQKTHYYLCHASYKDKKAGHNLDQDIRLDFSIPTNKITKSFLEGFTNQIQIETQKKYPEMEVYDVRINSVSYLGEMTEAEFNS